MKHAVIGVLVFVMAIGFGWQADIAYARVSLTDLQNQINDLQGQINNIQLTPGPQGPPGPEGPPGPGDPDLPEMKDTICELAKETGTPLPSFCDTLTIIVEGANGNIEVPAACTPGDYSCQAKAVCEYVTGTTCVFQQYDCAYGNRGSWYPEDGSSGSSNFNFAFDYEFHDTLTDYGNICACTQSQMTRYGLYDGYTYCGLGHWYRQ